MVSVNIWLEAPLFVRQSAYWSWVLIQVREFTTFCSSMSLMFPMSTLMRPFWVCLLEYTACTTSLLSQNASVLMSFSGMFIIWISCAFSTTACSKAARSAKASESKMLDTTLCTLQDFQVRRLQGPWRPSWYPFVRKMRYPKELETPSGRFAREASEKTKK